MIKKYIIFILILLIIYLIFLNIKFKKARDLNFFRKKNTFNYWIDSLKYDRLDEKKFFVDKYSSKLYVQKHFPEIKVIKTLYLYENPKDIHNINIPDYCVLKSTYGGGSLRNIIITPKNKISKKKIELITTFWNKIKYGNKILPYYSEPQYFGKNRIIIEEYMGNLNDYKFIIIKGRIAFIQLDINRFNHHRRNLYDEDWNILDFTSGYKQTDYNVERPQTLEKMKQFCKKFYRKTKFEFVRIDLYEINNEIYFGEFTFTPFCGLVDFSNNYDKIIYDKYIKNI